MGKDFHREVGRLLTNFQKAKPIIKTMITVSRDQVTVLGFVS